MCPEGYCTGIHGSRGVGTLCVSISPPIQIPANSYVRQEYFANLDSRQFRLSPGIFSTNQISREISWREFESAEIWTGGIKIGNIRYN